MIPDTLTGLVLFAVSLGPGYVYLRVAERRVPQAERSQLLQATELLVIGTLITTTVTMLVLAGAFAIDLVDPTTARREGLGYLLLHPLRGFATLGTIFVLSYGVAGLAAWLIHKDAPASQQPGTVWRAVLGQDKGTHDAIATVELRDGRTLQGQVASYTLDAPGESRELALRAPMRQRSAKGSTVEQVQDDFLILREEDVLYGAVRYHLKPSAPST